MVEGEIMQPHEIKRRWVNFWKPSRHMPSIYKRSIVTAIDGELWYSVRWDYDSHFPVRWSKLPFKHYGHKPKRKALGAWEHYIEVETPPLNGEMTWILYEFEPENERHGN